MIRDASTPSLFDRPRVEDLRPAAHDGEQWRERVLALVATLPEPVYPSDLRAAASRLDLEPAHPNWWGSVWAALKAAGWRKEYLPRTSPVASRNQASEPFAWRRS